MEEMVSAMIKEIEIKSEFAGDAIQTLYFGGGTPSLLDENQLGKLVDTVHKQFSFDKNLELTLEINPEDISEEKVASWKTIGINRFSMGIQTMHQETLTFLNRPHSPDQIMQSISTLKDAGFENISADLIFAIPNLKDDVLKSDLEFLITEGFPHISIYGLTIEEKTVFGNWLEKGKITTVDDALYAQQYMLVHDMLEQAGYVHYEVSNFAKPGYQSEHNKSYWDQKPFFGIGPGAHSFDGENRFHNVSHNRKYIEALNSGKIPDSKEDMSRIQKMNERIMTGVRTKKGLNLSSFTQSFGVDLSRDKMNQIKSLVDHGLVNLKGDLLTPTVKGFLLMDEICLKLFYEE